MKRRAILGTPCPGRSRLRLVFWRMSWKPPAERYRDRVQRGDDWLPNGVTINPVCCSALFVVIRARKQAGQGHRNLITFSLWQCVRCAPRHPISYDIGSKRTQNMPKSPL